MRAVMLGLVLVLAHGPARAAAFADVPFDHWAYPAQAALIEAGLLPEPPDCLYRCNQPMTRYEFAVLTGQACEALDRQTQPGATPLRRDKLPAASLWLVRLINEFAAELRAIKLDPAALLPIAGRPAFKDLPFDHWAYWSIEELVQAGILEGSRHGPMPLTHYEFVVATRRAADWLQAHITDPDQAKVRLCAQQLHRLAQQFAGELWAFDANPQTMLALARQAAAFRDVPADHWASEAATRLAVEGVLRGYPDGAIVR